MAKEETAKTETTTEPDEHTEPAEPTDDLVSTKHAVTVKRRKLNYTATTGRVVLRKEIVKDDAFDGHQPGAEMFLTAYTLDGADPANRPVTFAFNGGPGSSSVWLHLGLLGPRRVVAGDAGALEPPPYRLADNAETLLAESDLVFIDPVSTGYSRAAKGRKPKEYHGFTADLESVGELIRLWTSRNGRWLSPKFVAGESYGTIRAAGLAAHLQTRYGMFLNGVLLISSILNMGTVVFREGNDLPYALYVPTYAAIAHHHGLHGDRELADLLAEAEEFADNEYLLALAKGSRLPAAERSAVAARLAGLVGLSEDYVDRANLRIEHLRFFRELLRDKGLNIGRMDGRFTGPARDGVAELIDDDPSLNVFGAYTAAINHYLSVELDYHNDLPYEILSLTVNKEWSYKEFENASVTVAEKLASAMRTNEFLKVHVAYGYTDGATPYHAAEYVVAHLDIPTPLHANIDTAYYPAGHMMYVHEPSRRAQSEDLKRFIRESSNR